MSNKDLVLSCYRVLLRWSKVWRHMPLTISKEHLKSVCPALADAHVTINDESTFRNVIRWSFRSESALQEEEAREALDSALMAVKLLNTKYASQVKERELNRMAHTDRSGIKYRIGQVVRHKEEGYHGVVYGWDKVCKHPQYVSETDVDFVQPFYSIIPDTNDSTRVFGRPRLYHYVAQQSMEPTERPRRITNGSILNYFETYSEKLSRYIPKRHLQYEYPDEYTADDATPCDIDGQLLYKPPTKPLGKSHGRKIGKRHSLRSRKLATSTESTRSDCEDSREEEELEEAAIEEGKGEGKMGSKEKKDKDPTAIPVTKVEGKDKFG